MNRYEGAVLVHLRELAKQLRSCDLDGRVMLDNIRTGQEPLQWERTSQLRRVRMDVVLRETDSRLRRGMPRVADQQGLLGDQEGCSVGIRIRGPDEHREVRHGVRELNKKLANGRDILSRTGR